VGGLCRSIDPVAAGRGIHPEEYRSTRAREQNRVAPRRARATLLAMILEIRAAEGGDDAKLLVIEQWKVYQRMIELEGL